MSRTHYLAELESVRRNLVEMGETTLALFDQAAGALSEPSAERLEKARDLEGQTDEQHRLIRDQCLDLITLQAPVARDARFVTGVLDAIVDLELVGDYSNEIVTLASEMRRRPPTQLVSQISEIANKIRATLAAAVDAWRSEDAVRQVSVRPQDAAIRRECAALYEKLTQLTTGSTYGAAYVDLMLISRQLERILRHSVCVADQAAGAASVEEANKL